MEIRVWFKLHILPLPPTFVAVLIEVTTKNAFALDGHAESSYTGT